jgi:hypothetical protein
MVVLQCQFAFLLCCWGAVYISTGNPFDASLGRGEPIALGTRNNGAGAYSYS